eukprot:1031035-Rhodomonas_salina.3
MRRSTDEHTTLSPPEHAPSPSGVARVETSADAKVVCSRERKRHVRVEGVGCRVNVLCVWVPVCVACETRRWAEENLGGCRRRRAF